MQCEQFLALLDDWQDGKLNQDTQQEMELHLERCTECQALVLMRKDLRALLPDGEVPDAFSFGWQKRIQNEKQRKRHQQLQSMLYTAAAATVALGGALVGKNALQAANDAAHLAQDTGSSVMMLRAMPAPQPTFMESCLNFCKTAWPGLVLLVLGGAALTVQLIRNRIKKG